jgi:hypothetical protein
MDDGRRFQTVHRHVHCGGRAQEKISEPGSALIADDGSLVSQGPSRPDSGSEWDTLLVEKVGAHPRQSHAGAGSSFDLDELVDGA